MLYARRFKIYFGFDYQHVDDFDIEKMSGGIKYLFQQTLYALIQNSTKILDKRYYQSWSLHVILSYDQQNSDFSEDQRVRIVRTFDRA